MPALFLGFGMQVIAGLWAILRGHKCLPYDTIATLYERVIPATRSAEFALQLEQTRVCTAAIAGMTRSYRDSHKTFSHSGELG